MNTVQDLEHNKPRIFSQKASGKPIAYQCDVSHPRLMTPASASFHQKSEQVFKPQSNLINQQITANRYAYISPLVESFSILNESAQHFLNDFNNLVSYNKIQKKWSTHWTPQVIDSTLNEMISIGLLTPRESEAPFLVEENRILSAWLHITDSCNLRCSYCYLPHESKHMLLATGRVAIDAVVRSAVIHKYKAIKLKYAGGEPLLKFNLVKQIHEYAVDQAKRNKLKLEGVILSNGTRINHDIIKTLKSLSLGLVISLDGIDENHNNQRFFRNGGGSFNNVLAGIDIAKNGGVTPDISVTITGLNATGIPPLVEWLLENQLLFGLNFYRENDYSKSLKEIKLEELKIINCFEKTFKIIESNLPNRSLLSLVDIFNLAKAKVRSCNVGQDYLVFDYLGQVSKCQMQNQNIITNVNSEDPLALVRADVDGIKNSLASEKEECNVCEWQHWCGGGCPLETYRATGRYDLKSPNCNIYKTIFPKLMKLEGLRLLKHFSAN